MASSKSPSAGKSPASVKLIPSVLIANRGEIACRIIRTARRLGIRTIAVYSEADAQAPHVTMADEAYPIGPAPARESYLRADVILSVAKKAKAAAIHPGYGFLSENADFSEACAKAGIVFVGPPASAIRAMGLKDAAKALVEKAHVPVVPGYHGEKQDAAFLRKRAENIGFPVLIKAVAGGGGKGMKRVDRLLDFEEALASAKREAASAFGDDRVLIEKYITAPRHVEIQVFADGHGNVVHLFERDCSMQRRHQKVIEEAPAPDMPASVRAAMGKAAVEAARAVGYVGAGTVEFIADGSKGLREDGFFFMEMNTRLQVEHPVTEAITGLDLVEWQFIVASGGVLPKAQEDLAIHGHAVEARLYAEDPEKGFLPSTGKLAVLALPEGEGIRVDAGIVAGGAVTPFYDPMIAKIIAHGATRDQALDRLSKALSQTAVAGPRTNVSFLKALINHKDFRKAKLDTGLIERNLEALGAVPRDADKRAVAAGLIERFWIARDRIDPDSRSSGAQAVWASDPWGQDDAFKLSGKPGAPLRALVDGEAFEGRLVKGPHGYGVRFSEDEEAIFPEFSWDDERQLEVFADGAGLLGEDGDITYAVIEGRQVSVAAIDPLDVDVAAHDGAGGGGAVKAPMHGKLVALFVGEGDSVEKGQKVAVVEAMKMEHALVAPHAGTISGIAAEVGAQIAEGARILSVEAPGA